MDYAVISETKKPKFLWFQLLYCEHLVDLLVLLHSFWLNCGGGGAICKLILENYDKSQKKSANGTRKK